MSIMLALYFKQTASIEVGLPVNKKPISIPIYTYCDF